MSKGYFFELNQRLSAVEEGITIFDYTELRAYDGAQKDDSKTAKYPINMVITADAVCFKLHYFTYHHHNYGGNNKSISYHRLLDSSLNNECNEGIKSHWDLTHVEDVILELPFTVNTTSILVDIIKNSYNTEFPQRFSEEENLYGYIEHLIRDQFKIKTQADTSQVPERPLDVFYSSQWLMDIYDDSGEVNVYENNDPNAKITKFLRKLILDFMFDLKHSDVFQSSANFQRMLTGLMSDFYFSSLIHKCEFFYYRDLIMSEVKPIKDDSKDEAKDDNKEDRFTYLYAKELFNAQDLWTNDIMNPLSESYFEHDFPLLRNKLSSILFEKMHEKKWNSWFATPEEEMRRVYFTMNEWGKPCYCNSESVAELLSLDISSDSVIQESLTLMREKREKISRWFLGKYDFNDVFHLHFFKHFNFGFCVALTIFLLYIFSPFKWPKDIIHVAISFFTRNLSLQSLLILTLALLFTKWLSRYCFAIKRKPNKGKELLRGAYYYLYFNKFITFVFDICLIVGGGIILNALLKILFTGNLLLFHLDNRSQKSLCWSIILVIALLCLLEPYLLVKIHLLIKPLRIQRIIRNMHIILPKLIASIIAAWLTLSTGYVIFSSFCDIEFTWTVPMIIIVIVLSFIISRISRIMPITSSLLIIARSIELLIISYFIAFVIGIFAITLVGERYLYYNETFKALRIEMANFSNGCDTVKKEIENMEHNKKYKAILQENIIKYKISTKDENGNYGPYRLFAVKYTIPNTKTMTKTKTNTKYDLFIMPDFLIMFSFITMFIGIFLQMAFFDTRRMTDF